MSCNPDLTPRQGDGHQESEARAAWDAPFALDGKGPVDVRVAVVPFSRALAICFVAFFHSAFVVVERMIPVQTKPTVEGTKSAAT